MPAPLVSKDELNTETKLFVMKSFYQTSIFSLLLVLGSVFSNLHAQSPAEMTRDDRFEFFSGDVPPEFDQPGREIVANGSDSAPATHGLRTNACPAGFIMNTPYNSNNGQRGCMFDVFAANAVTIRCFESNLYAGTTADYEIYYRAGTHVGFENNAAAWTFLGGETGVTSAGTNVPTALNIPINITIPAGQTYSFYITNTFGAGTSYTDGTAVGNFLAADANITVFEGVGKSYPFGLTFNVRNFNGTIFYDLGSVLDGDEMLLAGEVGELGNELEWSLAESTDIAALRLERSANGEQFEVIADLPTVATGRYRDRIDMGQDQFYRLVQTNQNGRESFSEILHLKAWNKGEAFQIEGIFPNPSTSDAALKINNRNLTHLDLSIYDQTGREVYTRSLEAKPGSQELPLDLDHLQAGVYVLYCTGGGTRHTRRIIRQ